MADYGTKKLIDAEKAVWVVGGSVQGVMTKNAKWAFENKADAGKFIKQNGGSLATFDDALKLAWRSPRLTPHLMNMRMMRTLIMRTTLSLKKE